MKSLSSLRLVLPYSKCDAVQIRITYVGRLSCLVQLDYTGISSCSVL